jgi:hypothetical protein
VYSLCCYRKYVLFSCIRTNGTVLSKRTCIVNAQLLVVVMQVLQVVTATCMQIEPVHEHCDPRAQ